MSTPITTDKPETADVVLVQMPDCFLTPSLALSILKQGVAEEGLSCRVEYASHYFVRHLGYERYHYGENALSFIAARGWEFVFAPFTDFHTPVSEEELYEGILTELSLNPKGSRLPLERLIASIRRIVSEIRAMIPSFLEQEAERILSSRPKIVGFSVMTQQRNASFAMCRVLKEKCPELITIMGGGVCAGEAARQFLRYAPALDYVFTGEGDRGLAKACRSLIETGQADADTFPYLLRRGAEPHYLVLKKLDDIPVPDFRDYNDILAGDDFRDKIRFQAPMEASRGCWWAMKYRCRFCGLHYCEESTCYREKSPEKFWLDIEQVNRESGFTSFQLADCILSRRLIRSLPEHCPEERKKYVFFAECRTDLREDEIRRLSENGFKALQPGIESLQDDVLDLMNKGRRTEHQLLFLRWCMQYGIRPIWNIIFGNPGESESWYEEMLGTMRQIHHLFPPANVGPMLLARGSFFHTHAAEFGVSYRVRFSEKACGPDDPAYLEATADYYAMAAKTISAEMAERLLTEYHEWVNDFYKRRASLTLRRFPDRIEVNDRRRPDKPRLFTLTDIKKDVFEAAENIAELSSLSDRLQLSEEDITAAVKELHEDDLLYWKNDTILCLACPEGRKQS